MEKQSPSSETAVVAKIIEVMPKMSARNRI
jgi:hypothetical protein